MIRKISRQNSWKVFLLKLLLIFKMNIKLTESDLWTIDSALERYPGMFNNDKYLDDFYLLRHKIRICLDKFKEKEKKNEKKNTRRV